LSFPERIIGLLLLALALAPASAAEETEWDTVQAMLQEAQTSLPPPGTATLCWRFTEHGTQLYRLPDDPAAAPELLPEVCAASVDEALVALTAQAAAEPPGPAIPMLNGDIPTDALWVPACPALLTIPPTVIP
jgi:hypothetical protein